MKKGEILSLLDQHREEIVRRFAVKWMALFGSAARDEMRENGAGRQAIMPPGTAAKNGGIC